jgi:hypothetical protein
LAYTNLADPFALSKATTAMGGLIEADAPPEQPVKDYLMGWR